MQHILRAHPALSQGQGRVADYLLHNYRETVFLTASEIGRRVGVSTSTVTRLAEPLGYAGFPQLQDAFRDVVRGEGSTVGRLQQATRDGGKGRDVVARVLASDLENLRRTQQEVDSAALDRAATSILVARTHLQSIIESYVSPLSLINALVTLNASRNRRSLRRLADFEKLWTALRMYL